MEGHWMSENNGDGLISMYKIEKLVYTGKSKFQKIDIVESPTFGRMLLLDDQMQSSAMDEHLYHESLVHPAMLVHPNPKRVFIGGGGEGATAREILLHSTVEEVVMADLDKDVTDCCKEHLPTWHKGAFDDKRFKLINDDAKKILESYENGYFDVIILDLADPLDYGPCYTLYTTEFYEMCFDKLSKNGAMVTQSGPANNYDGNVVWTPVHRTMTKTRFPHVFPYQVFVPSFTGMWGYTIACKEGAGDNSLNPATLAMLEPEAVDKVIASRLPGLDTKFYDGLAHRRIFTLTKDIRKLMDSETRVISEATPIYVSYSKGNAQTEEEKKDST